MVVPFILVAGIDDMIGFVIFVVIIIVANVMKKVTESARKPGGAGTKSTGYRAPNEELQNFLKNIAEAAGGNVTPAAPQQTAARPKQPKIHPAYATPAPVAPATAPPPPIPVAAPAPRKPAPRRPSTRTRAKAKAAKAATAQKPKAKSNRSKRGRMDVLGFSLEDRRSLRRAIVTREILGPPVALKKASS